MVIFNNMAAMSALNETNRNTSKLGKVIKQAASGMRINSAGDDASGYSISERMKVRLRALNQDSENVRKGEALLKVAEGAIQSQMNLLKTVKERVINANNDTNTDADRAIIQKEIDQCYEQISSIAYGTDFDGKKLLIGGKVAETFTSWSVHDIAVMADDSDIPGLLTDLNFGSLDGEPGPFATFGSSSDKIPYDGYNLYNITPTSLEGAVAASKYLSGGSVGDPNVINIDLLNVPEYAAFSPSDRSCLDNKSFNVIVPAYPSTYTFTLTTDTTRTYRTGSEIDISSCNSLTDVLGAISSTLNGVSAITNYYDVTVDGAMVKLTTKSDGAATNTTSKYNAAGTPMTGGTLSSSGVTGAVETGLAWHGLSGGANEVYHYKPIEAKDPNDPDHTIITHYEKIVDSPAVKASFEVNGVSGVASGSGITIRGSSTTYLEFVDGNNGCSGSKNANGHYTVGKDYNGSFTLSGIKFTMSGGKLTAEATSSGAIGNSYLLKDGIQPVPASTTVYTATTPLGGIDNTKSGKDGDKAHWDIDLSGYNIASEDAAEQLIEKYLGKALSLYVNGGASMPKYEFIDTGSSDAMDGLCKITGTDSYTIDLASVRSAVRGGKTVAAAFSELVAGRIGSRAKTIKNTAGEVIGVSLLADVGGTSGNNQYVVVQEGELRSYTIDWQNWVDSQGITNIPAALNDKGFRFYCPTDSNQWVNVRFINGRDPYEDIKPPSGTSTLDIKTVTIDIEGVNNVEDLVNKIDTDLGSYLKNTYHHNLLLASDPKNGLSTIYDYRRHTVLGASDGYKDKQEKGAKIGTGIMDNVVKDTRNVYVNDLVIQHTDKASMNIHIQIPQTTLGHIFCYIEGKRDISEYNVLSSEMREQLLGVPPEKGILDTGLEYLTDAQTLIGAQINHMRYADENIVTQEENLTSAVSVVQDSDMAKVAMEQAKYNLLQQASQSMLAQANQTPNGVLSLLQ